MMKKLKEKVWLQIFVIYTRYLIGGTFVFASLIKLKGNRFTSDNGIDAPINSAWHFFETMYQSGIYWKFIGLGQLIAGLLLMTQRYSKLGALVYLPIITSVFVITISYHFTGTPVIAGLILLANLILIAWDWNELKILVNKPPVIETTKRLEQDMIWELTGVVLFIFTFTYRLLIDAYNIFFWAGICFVIGITGLIIGLKRKSVYNTK